MSRKMFSLMLGVLAVAVIGCNGPIPTAPTAPSAGEATPRSPIAMTVAATGLPVPPPAPAGSVEADIGPSGGTLSFGGNSLMVPPGSLAQTVHVVMVPVCDTVASPADGRSGDGSGKDAKGKPDDGQDKSGKGPGESDKNHGGHGNTLVAAVQFFPAGLTFAANALPTLTMNTNCVGNPKKASIVYTDDLGNVLERLGTTMRTDQSVSALIRHFSRYAVAW